MQNTLSLVKDVRGCMTRFDPLTPEIVADQTEDGLTYDELKEVLEQCGMDIGKVVFDGSRAFQNAFYADFELGHDCWIPFRKEGQKDVIRTMDQQFRSESFGLSHKNHEWRSFYMMDVPLPMQIYDFERRYKTIEPEQVFEVWSSIHTHIDYANGMWKPEVLEYVFAHAPQTEMPETDEDGLITIYRGMGEMSQDPANAISWSTDPVCALWFANRSGRGTRLVSAKVTPEQILVYNPGYRVEHGVILKSGVRPIFQYADMIPSIEGYVPRLLAPVTKDFFRYGSIAVTLGYPKEGLFMYHGIKHILRVLLLTLIYCEHSGVSLSEEDKDYPIDEFFNPAIPTTWSANCNEYISLRSTPGGEVIAKIPKGATVELQSWDGKYAEVTYKGREGYVLTNYIMPEDASYFAETLDTVVPTNVYSYAQMREDMETLRSQYPDVVTVASIGTTELGWDIPVIRIGDLNARYHVLLQGAIHGREHLTAWLQMAMADYWLDHGILGYGDVCYHIIPMTNPDGVIISQTGILDDVQHEIYLNDKENGYTTRSESSYAELWKANGEGIDINRNFRLAGN